MGLADAYGSPFSRLHKKLASVPGPPHLFCCSEACAPLSLPAGEAQTWGGSDSAAGTESRSGDPACKTGHREAWCGPCHAEPWAVVVAWPLQRTRPKSQTASMLTASSFALEGKGGGCCCFDGRQDSYCSNLAPTGQHSAASRSSLAAATVASRQMMPALDAVAAI